MRNRAPRLPALTPRQRAVLLYGNSAGITGRGFISADEELGAWMANRDTLLAEAGSAGRPSAYLRFELGAAEPDWVSDVHELFARGILHAPAETTALEAGPDELHKEFATVESIRAIGLPVPALEGMAREFGFILGYLRFRGRPTLIEKYAAIHASLRQVLRESLIPLKKERIQ